MVAIFTGLGAGFERGSGAALGAGGMLGSSALGRGGDGVFLNAASGNLLIQRQDEFLVGKGPDVGLSRTYNAQGALDDNGDFWRYSTDRRIYGLTGSANSAGSTIKRVSADGSEITYTYGTYADGSYYRATDGAGAHDKLNYNSGTSVWTWTDGSSQISETYQAAVASAVWRIAAQTDADGNALSFAYVASSDRLSQVTTADGGAIKYGYDGANNINLVEVWSGATKLTTRTRYGYDGQNRLTSVTVDLSPDDSSIADAKIYTTTYTYDGVSKRVASIRQTDGAATDSDAATDTGLALTIAYDGSGRVITLTQSSSVTGDTRTTTIAYVSSTQTNITDPRGQVTSLYYDAQNQLTKIVAPPATTGATSSEVNYSYDAAGNVLSVVSKSGAATLSTVSYQYDAAGNVTQITDALGNVTNKSYDSKNSLILESYTASTASAAAATLYNRYVYDGENHLRYAISAEGRVTEYRYTAAGELASTIAYPASLYSTVTPPAVPTETQMNSWRDGLSDRSTTQITEYLYDWRGALTDTKRYGAASSAGAALTTEGQSWTHYVYDQAGQLLQRSTEPQGTEYFVYDGMGRLTSSTDLAGGVTTIVFADASLTTTVTNNASGYVTISTYNKAGDLISQSDSATSDTHTATGAETYLYDKNGQVRRAIDATGYKSYFLYDKAGRKIADIGQGGAVVEYRYDQAGRLIGTAHYQNILTGPQLATLDDPNSEIEIASIRPAAHAWDIWQWSVYDAAGRVIETIDGAGSITTYAYDASGRLVKTIGYANKLSSVETYKTVGAHPTSFVLPTADAARDQVVRSFYDADGRLIGALNGEGGLSEIIYDGAGRKVRETAYAQLTSTTYRDSGTFTQLLGSITPNTAKDVANRYVYDGQGLLRFTIDAIGRVTETIYWSGTAAYANGLPRKTVQYATPLAAQSTYSYAAIKSAVAGIVSSTNQDRVSYAIYNDKGQLAYSVDAAGAVTGFSYDADGRAIKSTQYATLVVAPATTLGSSDAAWKTNLDLWASNNAIGARITRTYYNKRGEVRFVIDAEGYVTRNDYDAEGRLFNIYRFASAVVVTDAWTTASVESASKGGANLFAAYRYDTFGRLQDQYDGNWSRRSKVYYANGQLGYEIVAWGQGLDESRTQYIYDQSGRLTSKRDFVSEIFNAGIGTTTLLNQAQRISSPNAVYDALLTREGELRIYAKNEVIWSSGSGEQVAGATYRLVAQTDGNLVIFRDVSGQASVAIWSSNTGGSYSGATFFAVQDDGNFIFGKGTPSNNLGTLWSTNTAINPGPYAAHYYTSTYSYDGLGHLVSTIDATGIVTALTYDRAGRVLSRTEAFGTSLAKTTSFEYDALGRSVKTTDALGNASYAYFDQAGRVRLAIDAEGYGTRTTYTAFGEVAQVTRFSGPEAYSAEWVASALTLTKGIFDEQFGIKASYAHGEVLSWSTAAWGGGFGIRNGDRSDGLTTVAPGDTLSFSLKSKVLTAGVRVEARFEFLLADGSSVYSGFVDTTNTNWQTISASVVAPANAVAVHLGIYASRADGNVNGGFDFAISDIQVTRNGVSDKTDATTSFEYDKLGRITKTIDAEGAYEEYTLNAFGLRTSARNKLGGVTTYTYDLRGLTASEVVPVSSVNAAGTVIATSVTNKFIYDSRGNLTQKVEAFELSEQRTTTYEYDAADRLYRIKGDAVVVTSAIGAAAGTSIIPIEEYIYDKRGNVIEKRAIERNVATNVEVVGARTLYWYDKLNRVTHELSATGALTRNFYDAVGHVVETRAYEWLETLPANALGNPPAGTGAARTKQFVYDGLGRLTQEKTLAATTASYNGTSLSVSAIGGATLTTSYEYDALGHVVRATDARGNQTYSYYDKLGRKTTEIDAALYRTDWAYDSNGNVASERRYATAQASAPGGITAAPPTPPATSGDDRITDFTYDKMGRRVAETRRNVVVRADTNLLNNPGGYPGQAFSSTADTEAGGVPGWSYWTNDANGGHTHGANAVAGPEWFASGTPSTLVVFQHDNQTGTVYDYGQAFSATPGQAYLFSAYTGANRADVEVIIQWRDAAGQTIATSYGDAGAGWNREEAAGGQSLGGYKRIWVKGTAPAGAAQGYVILRKHATKAGHADSWMFVTRPQLERVGAADNTPTVWVDPPVGTKSADATIVYQYNGLGEVTRKTEATGDYIQYAYDLGGRMTQEQRSAYVDVNGASVTPTVQYNYNGLNDLSRVTSLGAGGAIAAADRVTMYAYGAGGRLLSKTDAENNTHTYRYDAGGRLTRDEYVRVHADGTQTHEAIGIDYDSEGRVIRQGMLIDTNPDVNIDAWSRNGSGIDTAAMRYNAFGEISERGLIHYDANGTIESEIYSEQFAYDDAGRLWRTNSGDGVWKFYLYDAVGNQTVSIVSEGTDLSTLMLTQVMDLWGPTRANIATNFVDGVVATITQYDKRNQAILVREPQREFGDVKNIDAASPGWIFSTSDSNGGYASGVNVLAPSQWFLDNGASPTLVVQQQDAQQGAVYDYTNEFSANGGNTYTFSAYTGAHRADVEVFIRWTGPNGQSLESHTPVGGTGWNQLEKAGGTVLSGYEYNSIEAVAPDWATKGVAIIRKYATKPGSSDSWLFAVKPEIRQQRGDLTTQRGYNAFGEVAYEINANAGRIDYTFNTMGRLIKRESPAVEGVGENGLWIIGYDANGALTATSATATTFRPVEQFYYDISGRLVANRDANGNLTRQSLLEGTGYGGAEALIKATTTADGAVVRTYYDIQGDARRIEDQLYLSSAPTVHFTSQTFDKLGRLTQLNHSGGLIDYYAYDGLGQLIKSWNNFLGNSDVNNVERTFYDLQGRIVASYAQGGDLTSYAYAWNAALANTGVGTSGGWTQTTTYANAMTLIEQSDVFNRLITKTDLGGNVTGFVYDKAARLVSRTGGVTLNYSYLNTNKISAATTLTGVLAADQAWDRTTQSYGYDKVGNLIAESLVNDGQTAITIVGPYGTSTIVMPYSNVNENATAAYDALGRMTSWTEAGSTKTPPSSTAYKYDANGNIRRSTSQYRALDAQGAASATVSTTDYWYRFDGLNRVVVEKGVLSGAAISAGVGGLEIFYDAAGQRAYTQSYVTIYGAYGAVGTIVHREDYAYDAAGRVAQVKIGEAATSTPGALRSSFAYDVIGRVTLQQDFDTNGTTVVYSRAVAYNNKNQVTSETTNTLRSGITYGSVSTYAYGDGAAYKLGAALSVTTDNYENGTYKTQAVTTNSYIWTDSAILDRVNYKSSDAAWVPPLSNPYTGVSTPGYWSYTLKVDNNSTYTYAAIGGQKRLTSVGIVDGRPRTVTFRNDLMGQVLRRDEVDNQSGGDPHEVWYRFGGKEMGYTGNNGTRETNYAASIVNRTSAPGTGAFFNGGAAGAAYADYDQSLKPINSYAQGSSGGGYMVKSGDTLSSIAAALWGDSSLWYKLAEANGLGANSSLTEGQQLNIPVGVLKNTHNANTFQPYDPNEIIGDVSPTDAKPPVQPKKKKKGCGGIGQILMIVVAVVVTIYTAGAATQLARRLQCRPAALGAR